MAVRSEILKRFHLWGVRILALVLLMLLKMSADAQDFYTDYGAILQTEYQIGIEKYLGLPLRNDKIDITVKEDLRFEDNVSKYSRSKTTLGIDYRFVRWGLKIGVGFDYINRYTEKFIYRNRYRYFINVSYKYDLKNFELGYRTRFITMYNDENTGYYNYEAHYYWRNRLSVSYHHSFSRFKYTLSGETYSFFDRDRTLQLEELMFEGDVEYRLTRRQYLSAFVRDYKAIYIESDKIRTVYFGIGWRYKH